MSRREVFHSIETSFEAFGFEIPVTFDGRRIWPARLKAYLLGGLENGDLSADSICQECDISPLQLQRWQAEGERSVPIDSIALPPAFAELKLLASDEDEDDHEPVHNNAEIVLRTEHCELAFPSDYPVKRLAALIRLMKTQP